jgi:hypothetical protein
MTSAAELLISNAEDFSWVRVKRFVKDEAKSAEDQLAELEQHHLKETTFLLSKYRELAKELLNQTSRKE